ncbi:PREDICTED: ankyrin repeat domain-containing protein 2-like [Wasmannia auropunctata]|uniref:ankyrin repeat domain-containing protein 2-like n=1 Tax=Wasmannia auropunctata TaxID=64793 RepID=UPI0005EE5BBC|nr:PREDICTED: ankyrin repeat domain-containing protein 2-like [Wasmannia auropunctata]
MAARKNQRELCILLLDAGASLHMVDEEGNTPLHLATLFNQPEITYLLLSRSAAINAVNNRRHRVNPVYALLKKFIWIFTW